MTSWSDPALVSDLSLWTWAIVLNIFFLYPKTWRLWVSLSPSESASKRWRNGLSFLEGHSSCSHGKRNMSFKKRPSDDLDILIFPILGYPSVKTIPLLYIYFFLTSNSMRTMLTSLNNLLSISYLRIYLNNSKIIYIS